MSDKPDLPLGYLGPQTKFDELGLETVSHPSPEFALATENEVEIKFKAPQPIKVTTNLINCRSDADRSEFVFTQTYGDIVSFILSFPEYGFYKFQVFALDALDVSESLPNAYNYLIDVKKALKKVFPFPRQYALWKKGCFLYYPLILNSSSRLSNVEFKVFVPNATAVAVVAAGEWVHLTKNGDTWEGKADLEKYRGKDTKVTMNAGVGTVDIAYDTLLEYLI